MKEGLRVLYAEDDRADADLTKAHFDLEAPYIQLDIVDTGQTCLARLAEAKYDVVLLDNRLPDMEGVAVLKQLAEKKAAPPVVMITGVGDEALVVQALRLGATDYVPKHGNYLTTLPAVLENAAAERRRLREQGYAAGRRQRRILYVEHDAADIDLTLKHFAKAAAQFNLEVARSSRRALSVLSESKFDLVLADMRMPDMSGLDLLREAKCGRPLVPFIIITGKGDEAAAVAALKLGAYDYIVKRHDYLTQLPYVIENAIARSELAESNQRMRAELAQRERAEAENARLLDEVRTQRQRMAEIIASVKGVVWESRGCPDASGQRMVFVSSHIERMLGYSVERWLSTPGFWLSIVHPEDRDDAVREACEFFNSGKGGMSRFRAMAADGRAVWLEVRSTVIFDEKGKPRGMRGVTVDITAAKEAEWARAQLEDQLRQAHKMESIGRLAGGVAHDFNNLLTTINGYAELALGKLEPEDPLRGYLNEIRKAGDRAAELTHQLLAFSRRQTLQMRDLSLNSLIQEDMNMLKRLLGEDVELVTGLDPELGYMKGDAGQIHQVILNIAVNARDAMPQGGKLTLETRNVTVDEENSETHSSVQPGPYVMLSISDTGIGMDAATKNRIFEPFFTTKEQGKGTGLGLSMVYGIVRQSGGTIWVYSEPDHGTVFKIYLPRTEEPASEAEKERAEPESLRGSETVLVVEDEDMLRHLACQVLSSYGYRVIEAANGREALLASERHQGPIHLMITDVVMPQMSGWELAGKLQQLRPAMRSLYMSGYTEDSIVRRGSPEPGPFFLQKPFTPKELAQKVRIALNKEIVRRAS